MANPAPARPRLLTHREREILASAERGESNKLIAYSLRLAPSTVSTLLERARRKRPPHAPRVDLLRADPASRLLTLAERAVLERTLAGLSNAAVARERRTSPRTVANQLAVAYEKLGVGSRRELWARYGRRIARCR